MTVFDGTLEWRLCKRCSAEENIKSSLMLALPLVKTWGLYSLKVGIRESGGPVSISLIRGLFKYVLFPSTHRVAHVFFFHPFHLSFLTHEISSFLFCPMLDTHSFFFLLNGWGCGVWVGSISVLQHIQRASHSNLRFISVYKELRIEERKHQKCQLHLNHWVGRLLSLCEDNAL